MARAPITQDVDQNAGNASGRQANGARPQQDGPASAEQQATELLGQPMDVAADHLPPGAVMGLQHLAGNAAVAALLGARPRPAPANGKARASVKEDLATAVPPVPAEVAGDETSEAETNQAAPDTAPEVAAPGTTAPPDDDAPPPLLPLEVPDGAAATTQALIDQVAAAHDDAALQVNAGTDAAAMSLDQAVTEGNTGLDRAEASQAEAITAVFGSARQQLDQHADRQLSKIRGSSAAQQRRLDEWYTRAAAKCEADLTAKYDRTVGLGQKFLEGARTAGKQAADNLTTQGAGLAKSARGIGQVKAAAARGDTAELRQSQAKAANDLAAEAADSISSGATQLGPQLQAQADEVGQSFVQQAQQAAAQVSTQLGPMLKQLSAIHESASATLAHGTETAIASVQRVQKDGKAKLLTTQRQVVTNLRAQVAAKKAELGKLGVEAKTQLRQGSQSALLSGGQTVRDAIAQLGGVTIRPEDAGELMASTGQLRAAFTDLEVKVAGAASAARTALSQAASDAIVTVGKAAETAHASVAPSIDGAGSHMAQVAASSDSQVVDAVSKAIAMGDASVADTMTALDAQLNQLEPAFSGVLTGIEGKLNEQSATAVTRMQEPVNALPSKIEAAQKKLDDDAHTSWLGRQWADIKEMVSSPGFWVGLGVGLLIGALIILSAGTATPFIIMAAAVAGGAAAGFAGTVADNMWHGARGMDIFKGAFKNALIGAAAGAVAAGILIFAGVGLPAGAGLIGGLGLTGATAAAAVFIAIEVSAVAANTVSNLLSGERWDKGLLAALLLAPLISKIAKMVGGERFGGPTEGQGEQQGGRGQAPAQLAEDVDPAPRAGETPEQARARAEAAQHEIELRRVMGIYDQLGERPPRINIEANDAEFGRTEGAHTLERHGPDIPLERGDAPGGRTIEGRIFGDAPWERPENWSYRWLDSSTMNRVVNEMIRANWEQIRSDLAQHGEFNGTFDAGKAVGDGFFNERQALPGGRQAPVAKYGVTSYVFIRLVLLAGEPARFFVETAYPSGLP